ncbi:MAG: pyridoxamine 5'-phosphate oxidase family protein [Caulobacteraceae bacterium]|nr:pyridoxamine 5'-phosphate oxidase family protein [Caulobacteraceae bacterium]
MYDFGSLAMTDEEMTRFLTERPRYVALASLRKDGSPLVTPVGYLFEDGCFSLTSAPDRALSRRLRRDPRVSLAIFTDDWPVKFVLVAGLAEEIDDPGLAITRRKHRWMMDHVPGIDHEAFERNHLSLGRSVFRVRLTPGNYASSDSTKAENIELEVSTLPGERARARV